MLLGIIKTPSRKYSNLFSPVFFMIKIVNSIYIVTKRGYITLSSIVLDVVVT